MIRQLAILASFSLIVFFIGYNAYQLDRIEKSISLILDATELQNRQSQLQVQAQDFYIILSDSNINVATAFENFSNSSFFADLPLLAIESGAASEWPYILVLMQSEQALQQQKKAFDRLVFDQNDYAGSLETVADWVENSRQVIDQSQQLLAEFIVYLTTQLDMRLRQLLPVDLVLISSILSLWYWLGYDRQKRNLEASRQLNAELEANKKSLLASQQVMASIFDDMKQERASALKLANDNQQLATIVEQANDAIFRINLDGSLNSANETALKQYNLDPDSLHEVQFLDLFSGSKIEQFMRQHSDYSSPLVINLRSTGNDSNDTDHAYEATISALLDQQHQMLGTVAIVRDISERVKHQESLNRINEQLRTKNREMEQFIYTVSHDLRSPLVTINAFAKRLEDELQDQLTEKQLHRLQRIQINVEHMEKLMTDLLSLSRILKQSLEKKPVDLNIVLRETINALESEITRLQAKIETPAHLNTIYCNESMLLQCLQNLLSNSLKYCHPEKPPKITIRTEHDDTHTTLVITDNGMGIDEKYHSQIFRIFERLDPGSGTGVGLAIVKSIMEKHQGEVLLDSRLGKGSEFRLRFPNHPDTPAGEQIKASDFRE